MLDKLTTSWVAPPLNRAAQALVNRGIKPDLVTVLGFFVGMLCIPFLALQYYGLALLMILLNRIADGLDGAMARIVGPTDGGGFLDITLDFIFYASVVFGFALANPEQNALFAALLIVTFMGTGGSFLAFAVMAGKHGIRNVDLPYKSLYYLEGLTEGTETIIFFVLFCLMPEQFPWLAGGFAALCIVTTMTRIWGGYRCLSHPRSASELSSGGVQR